MAETPGTTVVPSAAPWVVRVVGMNRLPYGIASEAIYGPFATSEEAGDWLNEHRQRGAFGDVIHAPQVMQMWPREIVDPCRCGEPDCPECGDPRAYVEEMATREEGSQ